MYTYSLTEIPELPRTTRQFRCKLIWAPVFAYSLSEISDLPQTTQCIWVLVCVYSLTEIPVFPQTARVSLSRSQRSGLAKARLKFYARHLMRMIFDSRM